jgi:NAD(P)-dependent dehydrogenase (short-subunit alcohol dehydrogenase family)
MTEHVPTAQGSTGHARTADVVRGAVAMVTGAGSGIGAGLVVELAARGARVIAVSDLTEDRAQRTVDVVAAMHPDVALEAHALDVGDEVAVRAHVADLLARHAQLDVVCSNAGIGTGAGVDAPTALWQRAWDINVMPHVWAADAALPAMLVRGRGAFLHTCSAAGLLTVAGDAPYAVTKHAAVAFAEWLALTYGGRGITVTALCPLGVETGMLAGSEELLATRFVRGTGRVLAADEVARVALDALEAGEPIALPHPEVTRMELARAGDHGTWLARLREAVAALG